MDFLVFLRRFFFFFSPLEGLAASGIFEANKYIRRRIPPKRKKILTCQVTAFGPPFHPSPRLVLVSASHRTKEDSSDGLGNLSVNLRKDGFGFQFSLTPPFAFCSACILTTVPPLLPYRAPVMWSSQTRCEPSSPRSILDSLVPLFSGFALPGSWTNSPSSGRFRLRELRF